MNSVILLFVLIIFFGSANSRGAGGRGRGRTGLRRGGTSSNWFSDQTERPASKYTWRNPPPYTYKYPDRLSIISKSYGSTFGNRVIPENSFLVNNYFVQPKSGGFLSNALYSKEGMSHRSWNSRDDRNWRATTKSPVFENKIPGTENILPAAAVIGAATAFGLASLLPLNVPGNKPLMYCNNTDIAQTQIKLEDTTYSCVNQTIAMSCSKAFENSTVDECANKTFECDRKVPDDLADLYCTNGTLITKFDLHCNSTIFMNDNETLECYFGSNHPKLSSFIPTTTTETPITTERELSLESRVHIFLLDLIGKSEVYLTTELPVTTSQIGLKKGEEPWTPEVLTFPPDFKIPKENFKEETTTTTTTTASSGDERLWSAGYKVVNGNMVEQFIRM